MGASLLEVVRLSAPILRWWGAVWGRECSRLAPITTWLLLVLLMLWSSCSFLGELAVEGGVPPPRAKEPGRMSSQVDMTVSPDIIEGRPRGDAAPSLGLGTNTRTTAAALLLSSSSRRDTRGDTLLLLLR